MPAFPPGAKGQTFRPGPSHVCGHRVLTLYRLFFLSPLSLINKCLLACSTYLPGGLRGASSAP
jgi:hypothetical protein